MEPQDTCDQFGLLGNRVFILISFYDLQRVQMVDAVRADFHNLAAEGACQRPIFAFGVHNDNIVIRPKGNIHDGGLHSHGLSGAGNAKVERMGRNQSLSVTDQRIFADFIYSIGQAAGILNFLCPERDRHSTALCSESMQRMDAAKTVGQDGV